MDLLTVVQLLGGLVLLVVGAEWLVRGAVRLAASMGMTPLVVGLTVVAFGTSSPELAVSLRSALAGEADIALGNVVGSNIANVLLILGVSALVTPLVVKVSLIRLDVPVMIVASGVVVGLGLDGRLGRVDGCVLTAGLVGYVLFQLRQGRRETADVRREFEREFGSTQGRRGMALALTLAGLVVLVVGSRFMVTGAVSLARALGVSDLLIGLTVVAVATSLPELATSVMAAAKGERDIAVGNIIGSNIFNLLAVLGSAAVVAAQGVRVSPAALRFDLPVMLAVAVACLPVLASGGVVSRWEGALFLLHYAAYLLYLVLAATESGALAPLRLAMAWVVLPLAALVLSVTGVRSWRGRAGGR